MQIKQFPAHITEDGREQTVQAHLVGTAQIAKGCLTGQKLENTAYLAGILHDVGKYTEDFRAYLGAAAEGQAVKRGSVVHTFSGVRLALAEFRRGESPVGNMAAELLAYAVGGHHGLFDCMNEQKQNGFRHRCTEKQENYRESVGHFYEEFPQAHIKELFQKSQGEIAEVMSKLSGLVKDSGNGASGELSFYLGLLARLLLSAVIEGDRQDTRRFMHPDALPDAAAQIQWEPYLRRIEEKLQAFPQQTPIQQARAEISRQCREKAEKGEGLFRLNVPTGAGKTLSSLRFAAAHAAAWGKKRIFFISPLLSILEQNAAVLRAYIGDDSVILEHHSNVIRREEQADERRQEEMDFLTESWSAPIIITTLVQLLNTLFDGKTGSVRRFQSLCDSVIVIDEVQTVPGNMLTLFNLTLNFLTTVCHTTVVLCSATQPCLESTPHPICCQIRDIVPYEPSLWAPFQRTEIQIGPDLPLAEIPDYVRKILSEHESLLVVCNKKGQAEYLFRELEDDGIMCVHLSAAMCPAHRRETVAKLKDKLAAPHKEKKLLCISTQVIEAGVDISFACAIRLCAGMDSVIQTAGRCNRNHESDGRMPVYIVNCLDEKLDKLKEIENAKKATGFLLLRSQRQPDAYPDGLAGDRAISDYYHHLYGEFGEKYQDFSIKMPNTTLYELLSLNSQYRDESGYFLSQAFRLAGERFTVFEDHSESVLVPCGEGKRLLSELLSEKAQRDIFYTKALLQKAKEYTVSVFEYQIQKLRQQNALFTDPQARFYYLDEAFYHSKTGFSTEPVNHTFLGV